MPSPCADLLSRFLRAKVEKLAFDRICSAYEKRDGSVTRDELKARRESVIEAIRLTREILHPSLEAFVEELGKENVHGIDDVEKALGFRPNAKNIKPLHYTREDFEKTKELKAAGIKEMLVLVPVEGSFSGSRMNVMLSKTYEKMKLGKFLNNPTGWYKNEPFFTEGSASRNSDIKFEWRLITKECIPESKNKRHDWKEGDGWEEKDSQEFVIKQLAERCGFKPGHLHRPEPFEMLYAVALHLIATTKDGDPNSGERLLVNEWHWSDCTSVGRLVRVGRADSVGAGVIWHSRGRFDGLLGACLSR